MKLLKLSYLNLFFHQELIPGIFDKVTPAMIAMPVFPKRKINNQTKKFPSVLKKNCIKKKAKVNHPPVVIPQNPVLWLIFLLKQKLISRLMPTINSVPSVRFFAEL